MAQYSQNLKALEWTLKNYEANGATAEQFWSETTNSKVMIHALGQ